MVERIEVSTVGRTQLEYERLQAEDSKKGLGRGWKLVLAAGCVALLLGGCFLGAFVYCRKWAAPRTSQLLPLIDKYFDGDRYFLDDQLPARRSDEMTERCRQRMHNRTMIRNLEFGYLNASEAARLSFECTKVPGLFEKVPEEIRGVFWMKGNAMPEELAVLQYGQWFDEEKTLVTPFSAFMWAWAEGRPEQAAFRGHFYDKETRMNAAASMAQLHVGYSLRFRDCPARPGLPWPLGLPGHACSKDSKAGGLNYANLQSHAMGDLSSISQEDEYRIEMMDSGVEPGSLWWRGIYGAPRWMGQCKCISIGSYQLVKIIDADGKPLEPYHSEFVQYMGDVPLIMWTGKATSPFGPIDPIHPIHPIHPVNPPHRGNHSE